VMREHLETFLAETRARDGGGLPAFVERELREFLSCGVLANGFARFRCDGCGHEILVAFSCKGRAFCPSCCGRRMSELAAHLTDHVLGGLPVWQWVLTLPHRLRYALAWDHKLCRSVLGVFLRALLGFERRRAARRGIRAGRGGAVTAIQRFGSALNLNVHFHTLAVQGVFIDDGCGGLRFVRNPEPSEFEIESLLLTIARRITRLAKRHGIDLDRPQEEEASDPLASESPLLAGISGASVFGRVATGGRAGQRAQRIGRHPDASLRAAVAEHQAQFGGFDLHAGVAVPAGDRERLEHLCRYVLRPPVAQDALELTRDGKILLRMRRPWHDGTRAILFEPHELIERLAALVPKPRINLLLYHGILGPSARLRRSAVAAAMALSSPGAALEVSPREEQAPSRAALDPPGPPTPPARGPSDAEAAHTSPALGPSDPVGRSAGGGAPRRSGPRPHTPWAELLRRTFEIDVLACTECGGRLRLLATIEDPAVVRKILSHLGIAPEVPRPAPARSPPEATGLFDFGSD